MIVQEILFYTFLALTVVLVPFIWKKKLLTVPAMKDPGLPIMTPLIGFLLFLSSLAYVPRWVKKIMHYGDTHGISTFTLQELESWPQLISFILAAVLLVGFVCIHSKEMQDRIWGVKKSWKQITKSLFEGFFYCIITYPIVMTVVHAVHFGVQALGYRALDEQVAIAHLKALFDYPLLFWTMTLLLVTVVPLIEELLFRGFLLRYFNGLVGVKLALVFSAFLFSLFHYSSFQGYTNIELMTGLFLYALFLGIFYLRTNSLWVPIGMHAAFNFLSLFFMLYLN